MPRISYQRLGRHIDHKRQQYRRGVPEDGSCGIAITAGSSQWIDTASSASNAAGYSAGATIAATGSNVTVSWTQTSDYFVAIGVEVQIPSALATLVDAPVPVNMPVIATGRAGWRNAGHSR